MIEQLVGLLLDGVEAMATAGNERGSYPGAGKTNW
jgi:hypothetical protein